MVIGIAKPIEFVIKGAFNVVAIMVKELGLLIGGLAQRMSMFGIVSQKTADSIGAFFHEAGISLNKVGRDLSKPFADAQKDAEKEMVSILTDKYKKDQKQQIKFKGIIGEFTTNFGKALETAAKVPAKVVAAALKTSVSDKFAGLALSGSQEEANLLSAGKKNEQVQKDQLKKLGGIEKAINKIGVV
jgi:hypothetical protein